MTKHRRWSDKPKSDSLQENTPESKNEENLPTNSSKDLKSVILSGTKYAYILAAAALLSGIFTPLTIGADSDLVAYGILSIFLGLGGGIMIFLGLKSQKYQSLIICGGLGMMLASLYLIYQVIEKPLFG